MAKTRINLTLSQDSLDVLNRMSVVFRQSRSQVLDDFVRMMRPALEMVVQAQEKIELGKIQGVIEAVHGVMAEMNRVSGETVKELEDSIISRRGGSEKRTHEKAPTREEMENYLAAPLG